MILPFRICALRVLVRSFGLVRGVVVFARYAVVASRRCGGLPGVPTSIVERITLVILEFWTSQNVYLRQD
jgi:hypothetical protein